MEAYAGMFEESDGDYSSPTGSGMTKTRLASGLPTLGAYCRLFRRARSIEAAMVAFIAELFEDGKLRLARALLSAARARGSIDLRRLTALCPPPLIAVPDMPRAACAVAVTVSMFSLPPPGAAEMTPASSTLKSVSSTRRCSSEQRTTHAMPTRCGRRVEEACR